MRRLHLPASTALSYLRQPTDPRALPGPPPLPPQPDAPAAPPPQHWPSGAPRQPHGTAVGSTRASTPPPLPRYAPPRVVKPPPLPKRVIAYVTSIDKNSSYAIWSAVAFVIVAAIIGASVYHTTVTLPAREAVVNLEVERYRPIKEAIAKANFAGFRPLADSVWFKRLYRQNDLIVRYQVNANHLDKEGLPLYISFLQQKPKFLAVIAADADSEPALRLASSIYVDVYDANAEYLYSYDLRPSHLWPDAVDPEPLK